MGIFDEGFLPEDRAKCTRRREEIRKGIFEDEDLLEDRAKRMKRRQEIRMCYNREEWARRQALLCHVFELHHTIIDPELKLWLRLQLRS